MIMCYATSSTRQMFVVSVVPASGKHNEGKQINKKKRPTEEPSLSNK